jgi:hypothetical protein
MDAARYLGLRASIIALGYGEDIEWAEGLKPPADARAFATEIIFVICNSGMKATVAVGIYRRVMGEIVYGRPAGNVFGHKGKCAAIDDIWRRKGELFRAYNDAEDKLAFLGALPWIGRITKFHVAKNFGLPYAKPDRHLARIAAASRQDEGDAQAMCERLSEETGDSVAVVDSVIWRAAERGLIRTREMVAG